MLLAFKPLLYKPFLWKERKINSIIALIVLIIVTHFKDIYSNPYPPAWILMEVLPFGVVTNIYANIKNKKLKKLMWPPFPYMEQSLLHTCNDSCKNDPSLDFASDRPIKGVFWYVHHQILPQYHISGKWHAGQDADTLRWISRSWPRRIGLPIRQLARRTTMEQQTVKT